MRCQICDAITENYNNKTTESVCDECKSIVDEAIFDFELDGDEDEYILDEGWDEDTR